MIRIVKRVTNEIIPSKVDVTSIHNLYGSYLDKLTALQWNEQDDNQYKIGDQKALDYDFHDEKTGESLYCLITRQDETIPSSRKYKWIMDENLYNRSQLKARSISRIPVLRSNSVDHSILANKDRVNEWLKQKFNQKIALIKWNKVTIYNKQGVKKNEEIRWTLRPEVFRKYCKKNEICKCVPIVMSYDNIDTAIQYLVIIKTESKKCDIGISVKYDSSTNSIFITGLHIDKSSVLKQHQIAMPHGHIHECSCLDIWDDDTSITHLTIGDVNYNATLHKKLEDQKMEIKNLKKDHLHTEAKLNMNYHPSLSSQASSTSRSYVMNNMTHDTQGYQRSVYSPSTGSTQVNLSQSISQSVAQFDGVNQFDGCNDSNLYPPQ